MRKPPSIKAIIEKLEAMQLEAHNKIEKCGSARFNEDRHNAENRAYFLGQFDLLRDLKYFVDPNHHNTSTAFAIRRRRTASPGQ